MEFPLRTSKRRSSEGIEGCLIDQGADDNFHELLKLDSMKTAMESRGQSFDVRIQPGYDHSYFFIQSFIEDHIKHHVDIL